VVGEAVLRKVVGPDALAAVAAAHLAAAVLADARRLFARSALSRRARRIFMALARFLCWLFSSWQLTTSPVGMWVMRTAESVVLTLWPPGPLERKTSTRMSGSAM
jgi:hypothetical protein